MPFDAWSRGYAPAFDNVPGVPITGSTGGRWQRWYNGGAQAKVVGSNIEIGFEHTGVSYKIDGGGQTPLIASGNSIDTLSSDLCAALVQKAKVSMVVKDSDVSTGRIPRIHNYFYGGEFTNTTRSNLTVTAMTTS